MKENNIQRITLKTKRLILTEWENSEEDINVLIKNFNDENIYKTLLNPPYTIKIIQQVEG